ncbi:DUF1801 domain-containing protein [Sanguibacter antarcticus]|uniref:Uncharacterized protein DUF1801 n=1 Tax=Sanguibacter antarcticus TaxID=372484 RepID=A0A2A9E1Y3_9MICO|nr:DUF1801 domain-containing protein [Sanguibacter antarcticus]PFG32958.1 uncharacterized protein DUF1801 [Sanguibacter antarcticus]
MSITPKTVPTTADVDAFIASVENEVRRDDARTLKRMMERVTGQPARMWGPSIVGFGSYHYVYPTGNQGDAAAASFSPRKAATTVYVAEGFAGHAERLARLGPHTTSVSCLYIKRLSAVDVGVLEEIVTASYRNVTERWPAER